MKVLTSTGIKTNLLLIDFMFVCLVGGLQYWELDKVLCTKFLFKIYAAAAF